jgi:N-acetylmuramoyl-L-alanine amidase
MHDANPPAQTDSLPKGRRKCGLALFLAVACVTATSAQSTQVGQRLPREGDEIVVCGQMFHTTTPVVLWMDPGGYDAYRVQRRFAPLAESDWETSTEAVQHLTEPNRYDIRKEALTDEQIDEVRGGGWELGMLQQVVDQFVIHYDVCGTSRTCFKILHDHRGLSVQFMLDVDGTIYQTLDLKERARHATISNSRSIGIEIANMGAYPRDKMQPLEKWYAKDDEGRTVLAFPKAPDLLGIRTQGFVGRPTRYNLIEGNIQGQDLVQYDFTPEQYEALIKLTATLCKVFPRLPCAYPVDDQAELIPRKLADDDWKAYRGLIGHYHIQLNKVDPGPAFQWDKVIDGAKLLLEQ